MPAGSAHPADSHSEAVPEEAFRDTGVGAASSQPGHSGEIYFVAKDTHPGTFPHHCVIGTLQRSFKAVLCPLFGYKGVYSGSSSNTYLSQNLVLARRLLFSLQSLKRAAITSSYLPTGLR